ncbi:Activating signal cointegrator 1 [Bienertia sinuspersici]
MRRNVGGNYTNPCLTMHQPWASLLVFGIKRIEGRSWPAPIRGRLWIHAASKIPEPETIKAMEDFYREIYAVNGIKDLKFPENYPTSRLLGCVEVVGCIKCEELQCWEELPEGVRLEGQTDYCWLCEQPQIYEAAVRGLRPVEAPYPVKFPLVDPGDHFSLKPGSLTCLPNTSKTSALEISSRLSNVIAGARLAATQFSRENKDNASVYVEAETPVSSRTRNKKGKVQNEENVDDVDSSLIAEDYK